MPVIPAVWRPGGETRLPVDQVETDLTDDGYDDDSCLDQLFYFQVDARDGRLNGGSQQDRFILKIWYEYQDLISMTQCMAPLGIWWEKTL